MNLLSKNAPTTGIVNTREEQNRLEQQNAIMNQYQQIIRDQDAKIQEQVQLNHVLTQTCAQLQEYCRQMQLNSKTMGINENAVNEQQQAFLSEKLKLQVRINELEVKVNLLEEKLVSN